jgi:hypothetical protein
MPELIALWWSWDEAADASRAMATIAWDVPRLPIGRLSCARRGSVTALKFVGNCQNSTLGLVWRRWKIVQHTIFVVLEALGENFQDCQEEHAGFLFGRLLEDISNEIQNIGHVARYESLKLSAT